jgi:hypothetical protein
MTNVRFLILDFRFEPTVNVCATSQVGGLSSVNQKSKIKNLTFIPGVRL